jgi:hypothetical protein
MALVRREVTEGIQDQSSSEEIVYSITTTNWGSDPSSVSVVAYEEGNSEPVTATVFPVNSPIIVDDVITLSPLKALTVGKTYRIEVKFTISLSVLECYFRVQCRS